MIKKLFTILFILLITQPVFAQSTDSISFLDHTFYLVKTDLVTVPSHEDDFIYRFILNEKRPNLVFGAHSDGAGKWFGDLKVDDIITVAIDGVEKKYKVTSVTKVVTNMFFVGTNRFYKTNKLYMFTCYYPDGSKKLAGRIVINAELIK